GQKTVANSGRGDLVGELALLSDAPRTATVQAKTDVTVLSISKDVFLQLIRENSRVSVNLSMILASRLVGTMRTLSGSLSLHDSDTNLPKRELFIDRLRHIALQEQYLKSSSALILLNLDELTDDTNASDANLNHSLVKEISSRLVKCMRNSDTISRLTDGYGFGIIADGSMSENNISRLRKSMAEPYLIEGKELSLVGELKCEVCPLEEKYLDRINDLKG
ncbi:MAG: cyclic nucleotide-binding domain-containing protein, partial [Rhodospirillales bacterium]